MREFTIEVPDDVDVGQARIVATAAVEGLVTTGLVAVAMANAPVTALPGSVAQAALREARWRDIEERWGMLDATQVAILTGNRPQVARDVTANLRRRKGLTGVKRHGSLRYPGFQFYDADGVLAVAPAWTNLKQRLAPTGWPDADLLAWVSAPNSWLDGRSPAEEIYDEPRKVTADLERAVREAIPTHSRVLGAV